MTRRFLLGAAAFAAAARVLSVSAAIDVGSELQLLWDDFVVDEAQTTAKAVQHVPRYVGCVHAIDHKWEGDCLDYAHIIREPWGLRLYYKAYNSLCCERRSPGKFCKRKYEAPVCVIESRDGGLSWTTPDLGLVELCGSKHNNCVLDKSTDNFFVFKDPNPGCPKEELYKALSGEGDFNERGEAVYGAVSLQCYASPDGIHFGTKPSWRVCRSGAFDTLNIVSWDAKRKEYVLYVRDYHGCRTPPDRNGENSIRGVRVLRSKDFRSWTDPQPIEFGPGAEDYPLYTNGIHPYHRAPSVLIGFPARTVERQRWTPTFDRLCGVEMRKLRMQDGKTPREGLTLWDTIFCFSRDGLHFKRFDEAMFRPGPEHPDRNWVYGDTMTAVGEVETPGTYGTDPELSLFVAEGVKLGVPGKLNRYVIRLDGFVSRNAPYKGAKVVTKPIVFSGKELLVNFSTSARGFVYVTVKDNTGRSLKSWEIFGDKVDRVIDFRDGELASFAGRPVTLEFDMSDADIYSFRFR